MPSTLAPLTPTRVRVRRLPAYAALALLSVGAILVAIGLIRVFQQPASTQPAVSPANPPRIEITTRFSNLAPNGQSTGFALNPSDGSLAIVNRSQQQVEHLDAGGRLITEWGPRFEADADAQDLDGIATSGSTWYLLDRGRSRILELDSDGHATTTIDLSKLGTYGPNGLAVAPNGDIYLADTGGSRILVFTPDGGFIKSIGSPGAALGQLKQPVDLAFGPDGSMFVSDLETRRIERWDASLQATNDWTLNNEPWGIAVDQLGRVFVPDADQRTVHVFGPSGELLANIGGPQNPLDLTAPTQVAVAADGASLWVVGTDGLAHVDLGPLSEVVPSAQPAGPAFPFVPVGVVAILLSIPIYLFGAQRRTEPTFVDIDDRSVAAHPAPLAAPLTRTDRRHLAIGLILLAGGFAGVMVAQVLSSAPSAKDSAWPLLALLVGSAIVWAAGGVLSARAVPFEWVEDWCTSKPGLRHAFTRRHAVVLGGACVLALMAAGQWWTGRFETATATRGMIVWLMAVLLAVIACTDARGVPARRPGLTVAVMLGLMAMAIVPRLWAVADLPYGIWFDEAQGAIEIRRVFQQGTYTPILNTYGKDTSGYFYIISGLSLVLGDTSILAMRLASVLVGTITVVVVFLLGRELYGWRVGVTAALIMAFLRWHIDFSRLGFNPISLPLCAALTFWLLARAIRLKRWSDFVWAGLALGLGMHAYTGYRGVPVVAFIAVACAAALQRWSIASFASRTGIYAVSAILTALPVLIFAVQQPATFNGRTVETLIMAQPVSTEEKLRQIWDNIQRHAMMFTISGDMNGRHNLPGAPMLDLLTGALLALGVGWLLLRLFDWRSLMLFGWALVSLLGGILTLAFEAPQGARTIGVTPVLAVMAGVGLVACLDRLWMYATRFTIFRPRAAALAVTALGAVALAWIGFVNIDTYFNRQMPNPDVFAAFSTRETVPAKTAAANRGQNQIILASQTMTPSVQATFLVPDLQSSIRQFDAAGDLPFRGRGLGYIFLETEHDQALADVVARMYPDATRSEVAAPGGGKPIVESFELDPSVLAAHHGLVATNSGGNTTWQGGLALDTLGAYDFRLPTGLRLSIDDLPLDMAAGGGVRVQLARGNHAIQVSAAAPDAQQPSLEWRPPGSADWRPVPYDVLFVRPPGGLGLQAELYAGDQSEAPPPRDEFVDPVIAHYFHTTPFVRFNLDPQQWWMQWSGQLDAPSDGTYSFTLDSSQRAEVWIDDQPLVGNIGAQGNVRTATTNLATGRHAMRVGFEKTSEEAPWIYLYWTPPGSAAAVVPVTALYPPAPVVLGSVQ